MSRRVTRREIETLWKRTKAGDLVWTVDGRRAHTDGYRLDLRASGGASLCRLDGGDVDGPAARSRVGLLGRASSVRRLADAVVNQVVDAIPVEPIPAEVISLPAEPGPQVRSVRQGSIRRRSSVG